jgi:hypothetical protein
MTPIIDTYVGFRLRICQDRVWVEGGATGPFAARGAARAWRAASIVLMFAAVIKGKRAWMAWLR